MDQYSALSGGDKFVIWQITGAKWVAFVSVFFVGSIFITYGTCLHQGHCHGLPLWSGPWNSISHSWEDFPGNYISRFVVGYACDMICIFHAMLYVANTNADRVANASKRCCRCYTNEVLLGLGVFACFCLTWVGAICDAANDPQCEGNNTIHSTCAVLFFLLTDVVAGAMACSPKTEHARQPRARFLSLFIFAGLTATTLYRACRLVCDIRGDHPSYQHGDNATIIIEVVEVAFFVAFMNSVADSYFAGLSWAATARETSGGAGEVVHVLSARKVAQLAAGLAAVTLAASYAVNLFNGNVPPPSEGGLPVLGGLWDHKPTNWIGRWGWVQCSSALTWVAVFSSVAEARGRWAAPDGALLALQVTGALALAGVGMVNLSENAGAHAACTAAFFLCWDAAAAGLVVLRAARSPSAASSAAEAACAVLALACALTTVRFALPPALVGLGRGGAVLEWLNLVLLAAFWVLNLAVRPASNSMALVILVDAPAAGAESETPIEDCKKHGVEVSAETTGLV